MCKVILFGGTTEGRKITEFLTDNGISVKLCVATEYGGSLVGKSEFLTLSEERLDERQMGKLIRHEDPDVVIDATHPYAEVVTQNIVSACKKNNAEYIRLLRDETFTDIREGENDDIVFVDSVKDAVDWLADKEGMILATTGSKDLAEYTALPDYKDRVTARVLSLPDVAAECEKLGFQGKNLICMQGPFSQEMNEAMIDQCGAKYIVTKSAGKAGGYEEKLRAAAACGATALVIGRPVQEDGMSFYECKAFLCNKYNITPHKRITLVGIGPGDEEVMTDEAKKAVEKADAVIGAERMLSAFNLTGRNTYEEYVGENIVEYINEHAEYEDIAVLLSGDTGFYSGARQIDEDLGAEEYDTIFIPGISSLNVFMNKIKKSWDDAVILSNHGKKTSLIPAIRDNMKVFSLLGKRDDVSELAHKLRYYGLDDVELFIGERLSYDDEVITSGYAEDLIDYENDPLCVICAVNHSVEKTKINRWSCRKDDEFIRDSVPMTKEEVRMVSLAKLNLEEDAVCYDVGAGTGSVSVEMAVKAGRGIVYAIEKDRDAVELLRENKKRFSADNMEIVEGEAPDAMKDLPKPTHVFIGGSSGNMEPIIETALEKNPHVRFVINCIAVESVNKALKYAEEYGAHGNERGGTFEMIQMNVSRSDKKGSHTMMKAENPITVISFTGGA